MEKPKKLAAIDLLVKSAALKPAISQDSTLSRSAIANLRNGVPVEINPDACRPWKLADRPLIEARHKDALAQSFRENGTGQIQPIVVRKVEDPGEPGIDYEVICGRVRWLAAKQLGMPVQAIVRELSDREAYAVMSAENRQRRNLSDFAKAKSYQKALALGVFDSAQQLADAEGIAKSKLSLYLGFAELPQEVVERFSDITQVPYRLGYEIYKACQALGNEHVINIIPKIEAGELSRTDVQNLRVRAVTEVSTIASPPAAPLPTAAAPDSTPPSETEGPLADPTPAQSPWEAAGHPDVPTSATEDVAAPSSEPAEPRPQATPPVPSIVRTQSQPRNIYLSSSGQKLFTYNNATRGWLIRIAPEVSSSIDEDFMRALGRLIESYHGKPK